MSLEPILLSSSGSDRGTGYNMSSKLIERGDDLFVGWLDAPRNKGDTARIQLGVCDVRNGAIRGVLTLGTGIDNHCGPALALDGDGRLHAMIGAHHGPFQYRWSDDPADLASWSRPIALGPTDTYPSLVVDGQGTLHLALRHQADRWQLHYRKKPRSGDWSDPVTIAISPVEGYNHFMHSLTVGPSGNLHLVYQFHYAETGRAEDCKGRAAVYLRSEDGGETWLNEDGSEAVLPVTIESMQAIVHSPDGGPGRHHLRVANHLVDGQDRVWFFCSVVDDAGGVVFRRDGDAWTGIRLAEITDGLDMAGGRSSSISRDREGRVHLLVATRPGGGETPWYDPSHEIFHVVLNEDGASAGCTQLTTTDAMMSNWLPALVQWDWTRSDTFCDGGHWFAYTRGTNAGGIGGDNQSPLQTEVYLSRLG